MERWCKLLLQLSQNGKQCLLFLRQGDSVFLILLLLTIASSTFCVYIVQDSNVYQRWPSSSRLKYNIIYIKLYCSLGCCFKLKWNISLKSSTNAHNLELNILAIYAQVAEEMGLMDLSNYFCAIVFAVLFLLANGQIDRKKIVSYSQTCWCMELKQDRPLHLRAVTFQITWTIPAAIFGHN